MTPVGSWSMTDKILAVFAAGSIILGVVLFIIG